MADPDKKTGDDELDVTPDTEAEEVVEVEGVLEDSPEAIDASESENEADVAAPDELAVAREEADKFRDLALRAEAEVQNIKRRAERDVENAHKFGLERFLQNLIPVVDSIEKAIEASEEAGTAEDDPVFEGIKLCHKLLFDVLAREKIEAIDPLGEPFDPNEHEALTMVENPDVEPNSVVTVVQKGYKLNTRLVRPAMVMVAKGNS